MSNKKKLAKSEVGKNLEKVAGHPMEPKHWRAFELYTSGMRHRDIAKQCEISERSLYDWRSSKWWQELHNLYVTKARQWVEMQINERAEEVVKGYFEVINAKDTTDRTANARIQAVKLFLEMGKEPLINRRPKIEIDNSQRKTLVVNEDIRKRLAELTQEEMIEAARTGFLPEERR